MQKIVILGAGGHAKSIIDTIEVQQRYEIVGIVDKTNQRSVCKKYRIMGDDSELNNIFCSGTHNAFIAIGFLGKSDIREKLYCKLKKIGFQLPAIVDNTAKIADGVVIGEGTYIGKGSIVNTDSHVGRMCIVNTGAIIDHECYIDDYTHVAVGAVLCGGVHVGRTVLIGANATLLQGLNIGNHCIVGAGTVITKNMRDSEMKYGNKCIEIKGGGVKTCDEKSHALRRGAA